MGKNNYKISNSDIVKSYFRKVNFNLDRLIFLPGSRNTNENIRDIKRNLIVNKDDIIITSAFHMPRVLGILKKNNIELTPFPVDYKTTKIIFYDNFFSINFFQAFSVSQNLYWLEFSMRECLALIMYRITGKTDNLFPKK